MAQEFYLNHIREYGFHATEAINHYIILDQYIHFFRQNTLSFYEYSEEINSNIEALVYGLIAEADKTIKQININFLINDFLEFIS